MKMNSEEKNEIISISKDIGEIGIDSLLNEGLFKDIPIVGTGLSFYKLINSASDRILLNKLIRFINELDLKNQDEINQFKTKYLENDDYKKIGSKILLSLERADDLTKIKWLAKSLRIFVNRNISKSEFLRLSSIINSAYIEDVLKIHLFDQHPEISSSDSIIEKHILEHLFSIGLIGIEGTGGALASGRSTLIIYSLNRFGQLMKNEIIEHN